MRVNAAQVSEELDGRELRRQAREKYEAMTRQQLIKMCDESWVDATGSQEEMIKRLIQYDASTNDWPVRCRSVHMRWLPSPASLEPGG